MAMTCYIWDISCVLTIVLQKSATSVDFCLLMSTSSFSSFQGKCIRCNSAVEIEVHFEYGIYAGATTYSRSIEEVYDVYL